MENTLLQTIAAAFAAEIKAQVESSLTPLRSEIYGMYERISALELRAFPAGVETANAMNLEEKIRLLQIDVDDLNAKWDNDFDSAVETWVENNLDVETLVKDTVDNLTFEVTVS